MLFQRSHASRLDSELVVLVAKGNQKAFKELLIRHQDSVYQLVFSFIKDTNEAEDITQETFLRLFRAASQYQPQASLRTFLFRIAKNLCIDFLRKKRPDALENIPEIKSYETPLDRLERMQSMETLSYYIDKLPENQRMAILLRHMSNLTYHEIAEVMGVTLNAVESLLVRARKQLRVNMHKIL